MARVLAGFVIEALWSLAMALVFYFVLTPIALLYRLRHPDPMRLRRSNADSYWQTRASGGTDFKRMR